MDAPLLAIAVWLLINAFGAAAVLHDKLAAKHGGRRVPEMSLHVLGFLQAWPGMVLAMRRIRHKTQKRSFQRPFAVASASGACCAVLLWLLRASL